MTITVAIPKIAHTLVSVGDKIEPGTQLYESKKKKNISINIAEKLSIKPDTIFHYLDKIIGEEVQKGELLASKKGLMRTRRVFATHEAVIKEISHVTGEIILMTDDEEVVVTSSPVTNPLIGLRGVVEKIASNSMTINIKSGDSYEVKNVNSDCAAELYYFADESHYFTATEDDIANKIIVIDTLKPHIQVKCEALGCVGFLCASGSVQSDIAHATFVNQKDYDTMIRHKYKYGAFTTTDSIVCVYN